MVIENRRKELEQAFYDNKLEFRYLGDCYAYVNYGKPSIENILTNEFNKLEEQFKSPFIIFGRPFNDVKLFLKQKKLLPIFSVIPFNDDNSL